ncbi:MAG TPA: formate dehydrogenase accessory sulfurtransferase FdhD [Geobacterales bacterium]|jgi:FdhD protein|nr:formate dehydrogenase accessory sulfurtransferase FdhD [Geobacterales bacterium]
MALNNIAAHDKLIYTIGRLASEIVIKTVKIGLLILASRSSFTAWGVELARRSGLTLIGRMLGKRFVALSGEVPILYDHDVMPLRMRMHGIEARAPGMKAHKWNR